MINGGFFCQPFGSFWVKCDMASDLEGLHLDLSMIRD